MRKLIPDAHGWFVEISTLLQEAMMLGTSILSVCCVLSAAPESGELEVKVERNVPVRQVPAIPLHSRIHAPLQRNLVDRDRTLAAVHGRMSAESRAMSMEPPRAEGR